MQTKEKAETVVRSARYYFEDGDVILKVEKMVFRFHSKHLQRNSYRYSTIIPFLSQTSTSEDQAVALDGVSAADISALLWFFYHSGYTWARTNGPTKRLWVTLLKVAEKHSWDEIAHIACHALHRLAINLGDARTIALCVRYRLPRTWLYARLKTLVTRKASLSLEECKVLGLENTAILTQYREAYALAHWGSVCTTPAACLKCKSDDVTCFNGVHICHFANGRHHWTCSGQVAWTHIKIETCDALYRQSSSPNTDTRNLNPSPMVNGRGDVYFKVEDTIFQLHSYHLRKASHVFADMFDLPTPPGHAKEGSSADAPITLEGETEDRFKAIIWFFYESVYEWSEIVNPFVVPRWEHVLAFATKYGMDNVCKVAATALDHNGALSAARKVSLGVQFGMGDAWAEKEYESLCLRGESLDLGEINMLGTDLTAKITRTREQRLKSRTAPRPLKSILRTARV